MTNTKAKRYEIDMVNGSVLKKMLMFAIPLICSSVLQLLFNAADIIVVGRFAGDDSLAAVGSTTSLINLLVNLFIGLSIGANVLVARFYGAKKEDQLEETIHTAIYLSIIGGILLTFIGIVSAPALLKMMKTPENVLNLAVVYLRVYFVGMMPMLLFNYGAAMLRAIGDTKRPMYYLIAAGVINVSFNMFFVIVLKWGVFGVGLATTISQVVSAILVIRCMMQEDCIVHLNWKKLHIHKDKLIKIMQIGLPAGFQGILFSISNVVIQSSVNSFGATVVAGNSAAANIEGFIYTSMNAFHQAAISFTSQNVGAGKYHRINRIMISSVGCATVVGLVMGIGAYLLGPQLLGLYTDSAVVIEAGMVRLAIVGLTYVFCGIMDVLVGVLRGLGYAIIPMIVSLLGVCALRILMIMILFQVDRFNRIETVYAVYPISWIVTVAAHGITYLYAKKKFKR